MTKVRLIPVITIQDGKLVKTIQFQNPRNLNSPMAAIRNFNSRNVDEMVILFIDGKIDWELLEQVTKECFMPLAVGGGIRTLDDVDRLFGIGADKVVIRTATELIELIAKKYGAQAVIYHEDETGNGPPIRPSKPFGELLITHVPSEGKMEGYDIPTIKWAVKDSIPVIVNGGAGTPEHFLKAYQAGASALAASSIWFYTANTPKSIKEYLHEHGVPVRLN